ncbi:MAG: phosphate regulon sensor histidine kinase PhoR [Candidatus Contendobacter sp.]|nr:phosphate regulon sensor histidine kinase PhoR [Candidatus Contendobacter sp.]MDG4557843.1 phosphate regulon sensor histidine kinase PhoR [Candidatus Contendobacter sp.]
MATPWRALWRRLALLFAGAALLGGLMDRLTLALLLAVLGELAWQLGQLYRLDRWLRGDRDAGPPRLEGIWDEIAAHLARLRRQSRKRKRKLSKLFQQFQQATAALPDAAVVLGEDDRMVWCNGAAQRLLGLSPTRDIGRPIVHLVRHPGFVAFLTQRRPSDGVEFPSPVDDAILLGARLVPYGKKQRLLLAADVSQLRRLEQMRRDLVANVSHELRTPLTVISGYLETLLDSDDPALETWRQPLHRTQEQSRRMLRIIEDLLLLARLEARKEPAPRQPVNVPALLTEIADDALALSGEQNHQIEVNAEPTLWMLGCEKDLRSAFANLAFNAVRYTPAGGRIGLRWFADAGGVHLVVEDDGEGIAPQHIPRLTERFYRVNRDRSRGSGGTGLGLSIVKHVVNQHGGQLRIASALGVGSVFTCDFPAESRLEPITVAPRTGAASR